MAFYKKLTEFRIWERIFVERLSEPLHLNLLSIPVWAFGSFRRKVQFDLVVRQPHAYGILAAADLARMDGIPEITIIEFGVSTGAGLLNMSFLAEQVEKVTGVKIKVIGFDSGKGMPAPIDYRDHPDMYVRGDFPMDFEKLSKRLPSRTRLVLGDVGETVGGVLKTLTAPIGYVVFDVDYYSSTKAALKIFDGKPDSLLRIVHCYFDDIYDELHNSWCGELLAIEEFNTEHPMRKLERFELLPNRRLFSRAPWIKHIFNLHVLDHRLRSHEDVTRTKVVHRNPFL